MAADTPKSLRNQILYSVFIRNYSKEGTFDGVRKDLDHIKSLGTDIIWLMPIHPVGKVNRKGSLGSPYSISDYRDVNPEFGTKEDFRRLVDAIHEKGMKVIIDVVYNHTSRDSVLAKEHPDWFYHKENGDFGNKVGDWWDVIDLDYKKPGLWDYQIDTLKMWAGDYGVDGFRCDVAPMVPVEFWEKARKEVAKVHPGAIWLAESVEPQFVQYNRQRGVTCASDSELYRAFDMCYEYDSYWLLDGFLSGENSLKDYVDRLNMQEFIYPDNYVKLRFLENHDRLRAAFLLRNPKMLRNWTAFNFFQKGCTLIYNGQEAGVDHAPTLFDLDPIDWEQNLRTAEEGNLNTEDQDAAERSSEQGSLETEKEDSQDIVEGESTEQGKLNKKAAAMSPEDLQKLQKIMINLASFKKNPILTDSSYHVDLQSNDVLVAVHQENAQTINGEPGHRLIGFFSAKGQPALVHVSDRLSDLNIPNGIYKNLVDGKSVEVDYGEISLDGEPVILEV